MMITEAEARGLAERYFEAYFSKRDLHDTLELISMDVVSGHGTGADESSEIGDPETLFRRDFEQAPLPFDISRQDLHIHLLAPTSFIAWGVMDIATTIEEVGFTLHGLRYSLVFTLEEESFRICHMHMSLPYHEQCNDESYPIEELREQNRILEEKVTQRTAELHQLLQEKELLLKEVHHRIKNNMNTIMSLLSLQARQTAHSEARQIILETRSRINSMMIIYDKLYLSSHFTDLDLQEYLSDLIDDVTTAWGAESHVDVTLKLVSAFIPLKTIFPIGIMVNELINNAWKYAFGEEKVGSVHIGTAIDANQLIVSVQDSGTGYNDTVLSGTGFDFGLNLVSILTQQLKGELTLANNNGASARICIPLETPHTS